VSDIKPSLGDSAWAIGSERPSLALATPRTSNICHLQELEHETLQ
jgi:hypothetical protein